MEEVKKRSSFSEVHSIKAMDIHYPSDFLYLLFGFFRRVIKRVIEEFVLVKVHDTDLVDFQSSIYTDR